MTCREQPKILLFDIETRPLLGELWAMYNIERVSLSQVREHSSTICVGAKWLGEKKMHFFSDWQHGHRGMLDQIHALWSQADAVCGYNSDKFDIRKLNWEFAKEGMDRPPSRVASIDVYKTVRREFAADSNKLDHIASALGLGQKVKHEGHALWSKVMDGDEKAQRMMEKYCKQDVRLLERVYLKLLPWISNHPKLTEKRGACPNCNSEHVTSQGWKPGRTFKTQSLKCQSCGTWFPGAKQKIAA